MLELATLRYIELNSEMESLAKIILQSRPLSFFLISDWSAVLCTSAHMMTWCKEKPEETQMDSVKITHLDCKIGP